MHLWKHESIQFMQNDEWKDYVQLKRWIWNQNDFWTQIQICCCCFLKNPTFSLWKCTVNFDTKYMKPNFTYSGNKLYKTPFVVYFVKAMSICTVTYEFEIVNLHMFSTWLIKCIMGIDLLFWNLACTSIKPDSFLWSLQHFLWIGQ